MNTIQDLERLVAAIEKQGANVAPTYQVYAAGLRYRQRLRRGGTVVVPSHLPYLGKVCVRRGGQTLRPRLKGVTGETESGLSITGQRPPA